MGGRGDGGGWWHGDQPCSSRPRLWHTRRKFSNGVMDLGILGSTKASVESESLANSNALKTLPGLLETVSRFWYDDSSNSRNWLVSCILSLVYPSWITTKTQHPQKPHFNDHWLGLSLQMQISKSGPDISRVDPLNEYLKAVSLANWGKPDHSQGSLRYLSVRLVFLALIANMVMKHNAHNRFKYISSYVYILYLNR